MQKAIVLVSGLVSAVAMHAIACSSSTPVASDDAGIVGGSSSGSSSGAGSSSGTTGSSSGTASSSGSSSGTVSGSSSGTASGSSSGASGDAGAWIDLTGNATGCDNHPGTPCGYTTTNEGQGYVCVCYNGTDLDPWNCEPAGSCVIPGSACPASNAPVCDGGTGGDSGGGDDAGDGG